MLKQWLENEVTKSFFGYLEAKEASLIKEIIDDESSDAVQLAVKRGMVKGIRFSEDYASRYETLARVGEKKNG